MNAWEVYACDSGWGTHPVVIIFHPARAARKQFVDVLDGSSQRANRPPAENEVVLDQADGLDWPTFCKCDCIFAVPREELKQLKGAITPDQRRQIVRSTIQSHSWNAL
jgi:hypothetical protein